MLKWIAFFALAFVGIFTGLLFATGIAQKQIFPSLKKQVGMAPVAAAKPARADSTVAVRPDSVPTVAVASVAPELAPVKKPAPAPRSPEQQVRDASIAKVFASMDPDQAAKILNELDDPTALAILAKLKADQAAKVLQAIGSDRSVRLTRTWASVGLLAGDAR